MTGWPALGSPGPLRLLGSLTPEEVLYGFDGQAWIFTSRSEVFGQLLVYLADEDEPLKVQRYLVSTHLRAEILAGLKEGQIPVGDAILSGDLLFGVERDFSGRWLGARSFRPTELPERAFPEPGTMLLPEHTAQILSPLLDAIAAENRLRLPPPRELTELLTDTSPQATSEEAEDLWLFFRAVWARADPEKRRAIRAALQAESRRPTPSSSS